MVVYKEDVTPSSVLGATVAKDGSNPENKKASDLGVEESYSEVDEVVLGNQDYMSNGESLMRKENMMMMHMKNILKAQMAFCKKFDINLHG
ncbi:hypothetical protein Tco_0017226 [Tanacetum coccineum]